MTPLEGCWYVPAGYFILAVPDEQLPDPFGSKSVLSGVLEVRLQILVDLLEDGLS